MLWMLEQNSGIRTVCLCLDHDATGIEVLQTIWGSTFCRADTDPAADFRRCNELRMFLRSLGGEAVLGFDIFVPVFIFRLKDLNAIVSAFPENVCQPPASLNACCVMIQRTAPDG